MRCASNSKPPAGSTHHSGKKPAGHGVPGWSLLVIGEAGLPLLLLLAKLAQLFFG
jgi:hypothetical protein